MSRTAHHIPDRRTPYGIWRRSLRCLPWGHHPHTYPERRHEIYDLRYSAAELRKAEKEGRRPCPQKIRRAFEVYEYCCAFVDDGIRTLAEIAEGTARMRTRMACLAARHDAETVIEPTRHRHGAHRDSW